MEKKNHSSLARRPRRFCRCKNSILHFRKIAITLILGFPLPGELYSYESTTKLSKEEIMFERIGKGINVDVSHLGGGPPEKMLYDPAQYDAVKAAGFQSIRFFVVAGEDPAIYKTRIQDAFDRDLAVVICLWGSGQWASKPKEGIQEFVAIWDRIAKYYKDYPGSLVFELWNEPAGLIVEPGGIQGIKDGKTVMEYLNAAIPIIRKTNPDRILGIGGPGFNGGRELEEFVTPEYLTYRLEDGSGFADDTNIIGIFHMYQPHKFTHGTLGLDEVLGWKDEVREQMSHPVAFYKLSFLAKSVGGLGTLKVRLADVSGSSDGFWTSTPVTISNAKREYAIEYKHTGGDVRDVRVAFLFGDRDQVILLDRIALHGYRE